MYFDGRTIGFADGLDVDYMKKRVVKDPKVVSPGRCLNAAPNY